VLVDDREGGGDRGDGGVQIAAEQQPAEHPHGVAGHLAVQVHRTARGGCRVPSLQQAGGLFGHDRGVAGDPLAGEQRLDAAPLPLPVVAVAGQQPIAKRRGDLAGQG
jgi:hypothetical protein